MPKAKTPLIVVVANGRYEMFGTPNARTFALAEILKNQGGINESVADGTYHFTARRKGLKLELSLEPAPAE